MRLTRSTLVACLAIVIGTTALARAVYLHLSGTSDALVREAVVWLHPLPARAAGPIQTLTTHRRWDGRIAIFRQMPENLHDFTGATVTGFASLAAAGRQNRVH
jgi:hypothetical protein